MAIEVADRDATSRTTRVVVALDGVDVSRHFGRSPEYAVYDISGAMIAARIIIPNPGHEPDFLPQYFGSMDVDCVITGGISRRACQWFESKKIHVIVGISGRAETAVASLVAGTLSAGENLCERPAEGSCSCELLQKYRMIDR